MRKRNLNKNYQYGLVLQEESQVFKTDIYNRIGLRKFFLNKKILDLGCGHGTDSIILAKFAKQVIGVDIIKYKEWKLFEGKNIQFLKANSNNLPFKDNTFEGVYLKDLLHHIKGDVENVLKEIKRVTKPYGTIVILEGNRFNVLFYLYVTKIRGHDHFTQAEFKKLVQVKFPNTRFIYLEAYPPFRIPLRVYRFILRIEKSFNKLKFLSPFFSYNIAIIKNVKSPSGKGAKRSK